jgi:NADPH-dependent curcumin reductase CurA
MRMHPTNRQWILKSRPEGPQIDRALFERRESPLPAYVRDGEFLIRNRWFSCDPSQRAWMDADTYLPPVTLGQTMRAFAGGEVVDSRHPGFKRGDLVTGLFGWQDYAVSDGRDALGPVTKLAPGIDLQSALSLFGITGMTAYFGLFEIGKPVPGDTVLVSGAAGATGVIAAQLAKASGHRTIGIAGGADKCRWLTQELGLDEAIDYKAGKAIDAVRALCPEGVNVYFDNIGGDILDAGLAHLAPGARVVLSGALSGYGNFEQMPVIRHYPNLILKHARMEGFLVFDYLARGAEAVARMSPWLAAGRLKNPVDIAEGFDSAPDALIRLFAGKNRGKQLVRID